MTLLLPGVLGAEVSKSLPPSEKIAFNKKGALDVEIVSSAECTWGDLDIITLDVREHDTKKKPANILLSIESADGATVLVGKTNIPEFYRQEQKELQGLELAKPKHLEKKIPVGVFVCKDFQNTQSCRDKEIKDYKDIFHRHTMKVEADGTISEELPDSMKPDTLAADVIYFYQPAFLGPDGLEFFSSGFTKEELENYAKSLSDEHGLSEKAVQRVVQGVDLLRSGELSQKNGKLIVDLPASDQARCSDAVRDTAVR